MPEDEGAKARPPAPRPIVGLFEGLLRQQPNAEERLEQQLAQERRQVGSSFASKNSFGSVEQIGAQRLVHRDDGVRMESQVVFDACWRRFVEKNGTNFRIPREIIWLNGAPGSGKGVSTPHILQARGLSRSICVSSLLASMPEARSFIDTGEMISDNVVGDLLLDTILCAGSGGGACNGASLCAGNNACSSGSSRCVGGADAASAAALQPDCGVVVDGFPRTALQVDFLKLLHERLQALADAHAGGPLAASFPRPSCKVVVLYVDEETSVRRQLARAVQAEQHNRRVLDAGGAAAQLLPARATDADAATARKRYHIFRQHYSALLRLKRYFPFTLIDAMGSQADTQDQISSELRYQSSLDLSEETYAAIRHLPLAADVSRTARQQLARRLERYCTQLRPLFGAVLARIQSGLLPALQLGGHAGDAQWVTRDELFGEHPEAVAMLLDVLADRGFEATYVAEEQVVPSRWDAASGTISVERVPLHRFRVRFGAAAADGGVVGALKAAEVAARVAEVVRAGAGGAAGSDADGSGFSCGPAPPKLTESSIPLHLDAEARLRRQQDKAAAAQRRRAVFGCGGYASAASDGRCLSSGCTASDGEEAEAAAGAA